MLVNFPQCLLCFVFHNSMPLYISWEYLFGSLRLHFHNACPREPAVWLGVEVGGKSRRGQQVRDSQLVILGKCTSHHLTKTSHSELR